MDVFAALADPIRRDILRRLARGPARVVDVAAEHPVSRPAISRHLRVLGDAGLVHATDHGRERHYALSTAPLTAVRDLLGELDGRRPPVTDQALDALATEVWRTGRDRRRTAPPDIATTDEEIA
ncbi:ArsR/SmtB family transcription factor [Actinomarinicola tropica]|uniref:Metalloregulator ArsR/SmtB family transcription factor n=1 Tax=Actinomarinicola tropica TaxID=2789776 RepID=A0A5Q2RBJ3_9ACTN|nr:metalloregulator ArsR/SmtB family transcription factor [Actinomarinicola tropica]QGG94239.1 metalloregulator ArsR/SmtB family transcription factor [Actinomarinicola tropica]